MLLSINPDNPAHRKIAKVVECLEDGGIIIYPTDTVYGIGCDIFNKNAVERVCRLKGIQPEKSNLSFVCSNISHISDFAMPIDNSVFKMMKQYLPGPFTFILKGNNKVPKLFKSKKKTVGIRVPENNIVHRIVEELGRPILSTSLKIDDDITEYPTDPSEIFGQYKKLVDIVVDGGLGGIYPSTVVDCTGSEPEIIRQGAGIIEF